MNQRGYQVKKKLTMIYVVLAAALVCALRVGYAAEEITLPVGFVPNVQFAPLYVAVEKGFFADEDLSVTLDHNMEIDTVALVGAGSIPFGICSGEQVLLGRNQGLPLVYIAEWYRRYPVGIVSLAEKGLTTVEALKGKKVGIPALSGASYIGLEALLQEAGMRDQDLALEAVGYAQVELLTTDALDAGVVYTTNEPVQLEALGEQVHLIRVADSAEMVSNGLITNEAVIRENPELVERMTRAFLRGIQYTLDHPEEAYQICLQRIENLKDVADQELQKRVLEETMKLYAADGRPLGASNPAAWETMAEVMRRMGYLTADIDINAAFTNDFIPAALAEE